MLDFNYLKLYLSSIITVGCLSAVFVSHFMYGTEIATLVPTILGTYLTNRSAQKVSAHWAACKNPNGKKAQETIEENTDA